MVKKEGADDGLQAGYLRAPSRFFNQIETELVASRPEMSTVLDLLSFFYLRRQQMQ